VYDEGLLPVPEKRQAKATACGFTIKEDPVSNIRKIQEKVRAPRIMKTLQYGFPTEAQVVRVVRLHREVRWGTVTFKPV
jgi:hypothetical protein